MTDGTQRFRDMAEAENQRVRELVERSRRERIREADRKRAELEVSEGQFVNLSDTVIEPTPEWLEKGPVIGFTPDQTKGTTRTVRSVRRVLTPIVRRLWEAGKITDEQHFACAWYRERHEVAGLEGRWKSSHIGFTSGTSGGGAGSSPMAMHEHEAQARIQFRAARAAMTAFYLRFFDAVVLEDLPLRRAARFAKCRDGKAPHRFRMVAQELANFCERMSIETRGDGAE